MTRPVAIGRWLACAVLAAAAGCRPRPAVVVSLAAHPREVVLGDTVRLTLLVANPGVDTARLAFEPGCVARFAVRHAAEGWRAHPIPDPCGGLPSGDSARVVLPPNGVWRTERVWVSRGEDPRHPLRPGDYRAEGSIAQRVETRGGQRTLQLGEAAPAVTLRVRAARSSH